MPRGHIRERRGGLRALALVVLALAVLPAISGPAQILTAATGGAQTTNQAAVEGTPPSPDGGPAGVPGGLPLSGNGDVNNALGGFLKILTWLASDDSDELAANTQQDQQQQQRNSGGHDPTINQQGVSGSGATTSASSTGIATAVDKLAAKALPICIALAPIGFICAAIAFMFGARSSAVAAMYSSIGAVLIVVFAKGLAA